MDWEERRSDFLNERWVLLLEESRGWLKVYREIVIVFFKVKKEKSFLGEGKRMIESFEVGGNLV